MRIGNLEDLNQLKVEGLHSLFPASTKVAVGMASCGRASGAAETLEAIQEEVGNRNLDFTVAGTGCLGFCEKEPIVDISRPGWPRIIYAQVDTKKGEK